MTQREIERAGVVAQVVAGRMRQRRAAEALGLSVRQVKRLVQVYRSEGAAGLRSRHRGRPSNHRYPEALRTRVLALAVDRYQGFGPTLASEYLAREHGIRLSAETLRQWMIGAGVWRTRAQRQTVHPARSRRPRFGELVQIDGSPHDGFEGRGPRCTMIVFIDDATSQVLYARLVPAETTQAYFDAIRTHLCQWGRPLAYYSDRHSIFRVNRQDVDAQPTQVERALQALDIELVCAHSPQAKGRVERVHQTFQDRFVKALRLAGIDDPDGANALLDTYLAEHNRRFAKPPHPPQDAHRPVMCSAPALHRILGPHHTRIVNRHGAIQFERQALQIAPPHHRRMIGKRLTVIVTDNQPELWLNQTPIPFTVFDTKTWRAQVHDRKTLDAQLDQKTPRPPISSTKPSPDHPWRKPFLSPRSLPHPQGTSLSGTSRGYF